MKRIISLIILILITASFTFAIQIHADGESKKYFALGDSIAYGYGLTNPDKNTYAAQIALKYSLSLSNLAVNGATSADMLSTITNTPSIKNAELITISIGGNDIISNRSMFISKALLDKFTSSGMTKEAAISSIKLISALIPIDEFYFNLGEVNFDTIDSDIEKVYETMEKNLTESIILLRNNNPDAVIILQTLYNPYINNSVYKIAGMDVGELIDPFIKRTNKIYTKVSNALPKAFSIADVASGMTGHTEYFYKNWDFHPTQKGHDYMAEIIGNAYISLSKNDNETTASTTKVTIESSDTTASSTTATTVQTKPTTSTVITEEQTKSTEKTLLSTAATVKIEKSTAATHKTAASANTTDNGTQTDTGTYKTILILSICIISAATIIISAVIISKKKK